MLCCVLCACQRGGVETYEYVTRVMPVEGRQTSMTGPLDVRELRLTEQAELVWIVGFEVETLTSDKTALSDEFMCHASLDVLPAHYDAQVGSPFPPSGRLFTLSQGVQKVTFPEGFGLPFVTRDPVELETQVLNLNDHTDLEVRYRVKIHFLRDKHLKQPMKALFLVRAPVVKAANPQGATFGKVVGLSACSPGQNANPTNYVEHDSEGEVFIPHWRLGQGREETKTLITERLGLQRDVTIHTMLTHLHPTAVSLELVDLTTMDSVFRAEVESPQEGLAIDSINSFSSAEGIRLRADHEYGLVSVYDNRSGRELDAMAVMYLYIHDPTYVPPSPLEVSIPIPPRAVVTRRGGQRLLEVETDFELIKGFYVDSLGPKDWQGPLEQNRSAQWKNSELELTVRALGPRRTSIEICRLKEQPGR